MESPSTTDPEQESRQRAARNVLEEARILLPGIQTLLGFQLIAVFSQGFQDGLPRPERLVHYAAVALTALTVVLVLAPVAYNRQNEPFRVSAGFLRWAGIALALAMAPLALALALDLHVVGFAIVHRRWLSLLVAGTVLTCCLALWFLLPAIKRQQDRSRGAPQAGRGHRIDA